MSENHPSGNRMLLPAQRNTRPPSVQTVPTVGLPKPPPPTHAQKHHRKESSPESKEHPGTVCLRVVGITGAREGEGKKGCNLSPSLVLPQPCQGLPHIQQLQSAREPRILEESLLPPTEGWGGGQTPKGPSLPAHTLQTLPKFPTVCTPLRSTDMTHSQRPDRAQERLQDVPKDPSPTGAFLPQDGEA